MDGRRVNPVLFDGLYDKSTEVTFDEPTTSSDGGAILLNAADDMLGLTDIFVDSINDQRQATKVHHTIAQMVRQRVVGIACGYDDCNDAERIGDDPIMRLACGRSMNDDDGLASQSTLSRFENAFGGSTLFRIGCGLAESVVGFHKRRRRNRPQVVTIDLDPTDDPTHGQQEFSFFHGHYRKWCYLPALMFISFDNESDQHLVAAALRPGNAHATRWAPCMIRRTVALLRATWPGVCVRVRLDGGYATSLMMDWLDRLKVQYVVAKPGNKGLKHIAEPLMQAARAEQAQTGRTATNFGEHRLKTQAMQRERRVIYKAEVVVLNDRPPRDNCRFVITNMRHKPENIYRIYRKRGDVENRIKELHDGVALGRTSCKSFLANSLRVLMSAASYMLLQSLRTLAKDESLKRAQVGTIRERLIKVAARVRVTCRRIRIALPACYGWARAFRQLTIALRARPAPG